MIGILMMFGNLAFPLLFQDNGYQVVIFVHGVSNKALSLESNYIVNVVM